MDHKSHHVGTLSPEMALLGQLFEKPGHGYDLHRTVITDLGQVWHLSQSQAYSILKRLETQGDVTADEIIQEKLPPRQILNLTSQGRKRFLDWLDAPSSGSTRAIRMEFVTRLYFLGKYMPERLGEAFERQAKETKSHIERLEKARTELPMDQIYNRMSIDLRLMQLDSVLNWLSKYQEYSYAK